MITTGRADDAGALIPGETVLWTGHPDHMRIVPGEAGLALAYPVASLVLAAIFWRTALHGTPSLFAVGVVIVAALGFLYGAANVAAAWVIWPRARSREVYRVTNWRVLVVTGEADRRVWSGYLHQLNEPVVRSRRDGTADVVLTGLGAAPRRTAGLLVSQGSLFGIDGPQKFPVLRSVRDGSSAAQIMSAARRQLLSGDVAVPPVQPISTGVGLPPAVRLADGERMLWAGRPASAPWWFGRSDVFVSGFGFGWVAFGGVLCALAAETTPAALVFFVPFAVLGGGWIIIGRVLVRRQRISRSTYVVTDQRVIATWQLAGAPVVVQAPVGVLLPPELRAGSIFLRLASAVAQSAGRRSGSSAWPATAGGPPCLIRIADPVAVRDVICAAQLAARPRWP